MSFSQRSSTRRLKPIIPLHPSCDQPTALYATIAYAMRVSFLPLCKSSPSTQTVWMRHISMVRKTCGLTSLRLLRQGNQTYQRDMLSSIKPLKH